MLAWMDGSEAEEAVEAKLGSDRLKSDQVH